MDKFSISVLSEKSPLFGKRDSQIRIHKHVQAVKESEKMTL